MLAVAFLSAQAVVLLTLALLCSTRLPAIAGGAICVVVFGLGWMAGVFAGIGRFFDAGPLVAAAEASRWLLPSDGLWRGAIYSLEPQLIVGGAMSGAGPAADSNPFFASAPPPGSSSPGAWPGSWSCSGWRSSRWGGATSRRPSAGPGPPGTPPDQPRPPESPPQP